MPIISKTFDKVMHEQIYEHMQYYLCAAHELYSWEYILFLLMSPIFFFFNLLFCRNDCAKVIAWIRMKFSNNVTLMRNAYVTQHPLVAILIFFQPPFFSLRYSQGH